MPKAVRTNICGSPLAKKQDIIKDFYALKVPISEKRSIAPQSDKCNRIRRRENSNTLTKTWIDMIYPRFSPNNIAIYSQWEGK